MKARAAPTLHAIANPSEADKATLYRLRIRPRLPDAELINAGPLVKEHFGHNTVTTEGSAKEQEWQGSAARSS